MPEMVPPAQMLRLDQGEQGRLLSVVRRDPGIGHGVGGVEVPRVRHDGLYDPCPPLEHRERDTEKEGRAGEVEARVRTEGRREQLRIMQVLSRAEAIERVNNAGELRRLHGDGSRTLLQYRGHSALPAAPAHAPPSARYTAMRSVLASVRPVAWRSCASSKVRSASSTCRKSDAPSWNRSCASLAARSLAAAASSRCCSRSRALRDVTNAIST